MFDPFSTSKVSERKETTELDDLKETFQQMMVASMMGSVSSSEGGGMDSSAMMMPMMLSLLEKLISLQMEQEKEEDADAAKAAGADEAAAAASAGVLKNAPERERPPRDQATAGVPAGLPLATARLTQRYHVSHNGLDFGTPVGTPIETTMSGKVVYAGWNNQGYGNLVIVENGPYRTYYAHLSEVPVRVGDSVEAGSVIGLSGNTGNSTGPHLHYEIRYQMKAVDPTSFTL